MSYFRRRAKRSTLEHPQVRIILSSLIFICILTLFLSYHAGASINTSTSPHSSLCIPRYKAHCVVYLPRTPQCYILRARQHITDVTFLLGCLRSVRHGLVMVSSTGHGQDETSIREFPHFDFTSTSITSYDFDPVNFYSSSPDRNLIIRLPSFNFISLPSWLCFVSMAYSIHTVRNAQFNLCDDRGLITPVSLDYLSSQTTSVLPTY